MSNLHLHFPNFNAGELSPNLSSRFNVEKVASGCRRLRNFIPHVHGPAFRRPGLEYMGASMGDGAKSSLRGFNFSTSTGFVLEFHPDGLGVWSNGVKVPLKADVELPYSESECAELQTAQVNDVTYIVHPNHAPRRLVRYADDDWRLEDIDWDWPPLGDENVRAEALSTPTATTVLSVITGNWAEFVSPGGNIDFSVTNPDTGATTKIAKLQQWNGTTWVTLKAFTWTTVAPSTWSDTINAGKLCRLTYDGVITATGYTRAESGVAVLSQLDISVEQPASLVPVTIAANADWHATVELPEGATIPSGSSLWLQRKFNGNWNDIKKLTLSPGRVTIWRGGKTNTARDYRFDWRGRAVAGGVAKLETLAFSEKSEVTLAVNATEGTGRTMTATEAVFQAGHVGSFWQIVHRRDTAFSEIVSAQPTITAASSTAIRVQGTWDVFSYGIWDATLYLERKVNGGWEVMRSWSSNSDRNVIASGSEDNEVEMRLRISGGTAAASSSAAVPRFVLEAADAQVYGLVKVTAVGTLNADGKATTATVDILTTLHSTAATSMWTEGAFSAVKGFPRSVTIHGQRLWFGGTAAEPQRLWGSVVSDYENFRRTSLDDGGVSFTPAAQQANAIQWLAGHGKDLVIGTAGDEWTLGAETGVITPTSVLMQRRSGYGSKYLPALLLGDDVVFVQRGGLKLRQVAPRADGVVWSASDLTVLAEHVTRAGVTQFAAMTFPLSILWCVSADGNLLGMTFESEQNVFAWHVHETDGAVESVAVVNGSDADEVWLQVRRNGKRYVERMQQAVLARDFADRASLMYLDSAVLSENAAPITTLAGLDHLNGFVVDVVGDGAQQASRTVANGQITLETEASTVVVGLPFVSTLQPMRVDIPLRDGTAQQRQWKTTRVGMYLHDSLGGSIGYSPDASRFERIQFRRVSTPLGSAPELFTGDAETAIESTVTGGVDVVIRQTEPFPLNIGGLIVSGDVYQEGGLK